MSAPGRVAEALRAAGIEPHVREFPRGTRTAVDAAAAVGCEVGQICKSLVFRVEPAGGPLLVIASGAGRVDEERAGALVGGRLTKADADLVRRWTGFAIGGVPPLGHVEPLPTLFDEALLAYDVVWAAAGTPTSVFSVPPATLAAATRARVAAVSRDG